MKKNAIYYFSLAAILAGSVSSCREADFGFTEDEISYAATLHGYTKNFVENYGPMDPNHDWGFGPNVITRANSDGNDSHQYFKANRGRIANNECTGYEAGPRELTQDEFEYYKSMLPNVVTAAEAKYVMEYIYNHPEEGNDTEIYSTYYIQPVGKVKHNYPYVQNDKFTEPGWSHMNYLYVDQEHNLDYNGSVCGWIYSPESYDPTGNITLKENFDDNSTPFEALVIHSQTRTPSYQDSNNGSTKMTSYTYSNGTTVKLYKYYTITLPNDREKYGESAGTTGKYLAFDYASTKSEKGGIAPDGHYDDWVVKITDAHRFTNRVLCEDLGSIHDWDFNDLVFDYSIDDGILYIDVRALSGTLPLNFTYNGENTVIVNSHTPSGAEPGHSYKSAEARGDNLTQRFYTIIFTGDNIQNVSFFAVHNATTSWVGGQDSNHTGETSVQGMWSFNNQPNCAPFMIQVPTTVDWPDEDEDIRTKYQKFSNYVSDKTVKFWE